MEAGREQARLEKLTKKEERRSRRNRLRRDAATIQIAPLGEKARALQAERRGKQRYEEANSRKGRQVRPSEFTNFIRTSHEQTRFPPIQPKDFTVDDGFRKDVEHCIRKGKKGKAVGSDGVHM